MKERQPTPQQPIEGLLNSKQISDILDKPVNATRAKLWRSRKKDPTITATEGPRKSLLYNPEDLERLTRLESPPKELTLPDGQQMPQLTKKLKQTIEYLIAAREPVSMENLVSFWYPEENPILANPKLRFVIHGLNSKLKPFGWKIARPSYIDSKGREREKQGIFALIPLGEALIAPPEEVIKKPRKPKSYKPKIKPSPMIPPTEDKQKDEKQKPLEKILWEFIPKQEKETTPQMENKRKELALNLTDKILSYLTTKDIDSQTTPTTDPEKLIKEALPLFTKLQEIIEDVSQERLKIFITVSVISILNEFWEKNRDDSLSRKERKILVLCKILKSQGRILDDVINTVLNDLSISDQDRERFIA